MNACNTPPGYLFFSPKVQGLGGCGWEGFLGFGGGGVVFWVGWVGTTGKRTSHVRSPKDTSVF